MTIFSYLMDGFTVALQWNNLLWAFVGVTLGTAVGILPGIGPAMTVAILLPITFSFDPVTAFILFAGIYYGGMYGGAVTSILLNTPGETGSMMTAIQGNLLARSGKASLALSVAAIGSFIAALIGTILLVLFAPIVAEVALFFGPAEYFLLITLGFISTTAILGKNISLGLISLLFGLAVGLVGIDLQTGQARFTFGALPLLDGVHVVIFVVGLFAVSETFSMILTQRKSIDTIKTFTWHWIKKDDIKKCTKPWLRGSLIGFIMGCLPAGGAEIPTFMSYGLEKRLAKNPSDFNTGAIEGVAGPESANNGAAAGVMVPLLTLGLPTSATAAVMLAAFQQYNIQPGPLVFINNADLVWGMIASLFIGNVMLLVLNLPLAPLWARLLYIPKHFLYSGILIFATVGVYSLNNSIVDIWIMLAVGVIGLFMRAMHVPVAPAIIGLILGPMAEQHFRRALAISQGELSYFVESPLALTLFIICLLIMPISYYLGSKGQIKDGL
jgi:putative tricarboxylic transport membrane protein